MLFAKFKILTIDLFVGLEQVSHNANKYCPLWTFSYGIPLKVFKMRRFLCARIMLIFFVSGISIQLEQCKED